MRIREASQKDASQISVLISVLAEKYILPSCSKSGGKLLLASMTADNIKQSIKAGYQYHVAEENSKIVGVVGIKNNSHLYHLFVSDVEQGKGLSKALWQHAKSVCIQKGNEGIFTVNAALNAKNVYLKLGFIAIGEIREKSGIKDIPMQMCN